VFVVVVVLNVVNGVVEGLVCHRWLKLITDKQYKQMLGDLPAIVNSEFIRARAARTSVFMEPNQNPKVHSHSHSHYSLILIFIDVD
jgi:hypothetical protein